MGEFTYRRRPFRPLRFVWLLGLSAVMVALFGWGALAIAALLQCDIEVEWDD